MPPLPPPPIAPAHRPRRRARLHLHALASLLGAAAVVLGATDLARADKPCPSCHRQVPDEYRYCPFDGQALPSAPCPRCHQPSQPGWRFCPFDGTPLPGTRSPADAPSAERPEPGAPPATGEPPATSEPPTPDQAAPAPAPAARPLPPPTGTNPIDTIDRLFRAIQNNDTGAIRRLYRWDRFFGRTGPELEPRIEAYLSKLTGRVGPIARRTDRIPIKVNLAPRHATLGIALRDRRTHAVLQEYEFELTDQGDGWHIVKVKP